MKIEFNSKHILYSTLTKNGIVYVLKEREEWGKKSLKELKRKHNERSEVNTLFITIFVNALTFSVRRQKVET